MEAIVNRYIYITDSQQKQMQKIVELKNQGYMLLVPNQTSFNVSGISHVSDTFIDTDNFNFSSTINDVVYSIVGVVRNSDDVGMSNKIVVDMVAPVAELSNKISIFEKQGYEIFSPFSLSAHSKKLLDSLTGEVLEIQLLVKPHEPYLIVKEQFEALWIVVAQKSTLGYLKTGDSITLKANNLKYLTRYYTGVQEINATRDWCNHYSEFRVTILDNGKVTLQTDYGPYWHCGNESHPDRLIAESNLIDERHQFHIIMLDNNQVAIQACNGKYLKRMVDGKNSIYALGDSVDSYSKFILDVITLPLR